MKKMIKVRVAQILAVGFGLLALTGCGKASAPGGEVALAEMNRAVGMMSMSPAGAPRTVDDLTNFPAFNDRAFPVPPAGKKFVLDLSTKVVAVVDK